jgi:RimJ/RimL family protein N-acetyltransferase
MAYTVFATYQARGYATEGPRCGPGCLTTAMRIRLFVTQIDRRNSASIAVVEPLGFTRVTTIHDAAFFKRASRDEFRFGLIVNSA